MVFTRLSFRNSLLGIRFTPIIATVTWTKRVMRRYFITRGNCIIRIRRYFHNVNWISLLCHTYLINRVNIKYNLKTIYTIYAVDTWRSYTTGRQGQVYNICHSRQLIVANSLICFMTPSLIQTFPPTQPLTFTHSRTHSYFHHLTHLHIQCHSLSFTHQLSCIGIAPANRVKRLLNDVSPTPI